MEYLVFFILLVPTYTQLISPCPGLFQYESQQEDRWYGNITLLSDVDLSGIWLRLVFDRPFNQLGNWFGKVSTTDNKEFLVKNREYILHANVPYQFRFVVKYNVTDLPPKLKGFKLNGRTKCPEGGTTGEIDFQKPSFVNQNDAICGTVVKPPRPLITHGEVTHEGEFPWHAALYQTKNADLTYICGASLISKSHLITVAHCVTKSKSSQSVEPESLVVYLGKYYLKRWSNPGIQDKQVDKIIVHPGYSGNLFTNDVAIIKVDSPVQITAYVRTVCLWDGDTQLGGITNEFGTVVGWGFDETGRVTDQLGKTRMPVVSPETCIYSFPDFFARFTSNTTYCAGSRNGTSACNGDSGGGMVFPKSTSPNKVVWQLRGLVSVSVSLENEQKCDPSHYVVFTDVAKYLGWIRDSLR